MPRRTLTILFPAYNESRRIESTLDHALEWARANVEDFEVLVVDDGSSDGMSELVAQRYGDLVRLVRREQRGGKGAALRSGVEAASKPWILFSDADLSIPIEEFEKLWKQADAAPIVIGSKRAPGGHLEYPPLRRFLGGIGQKLIALFVVSGFHDTQCGFKLYRTDVAQELFRYQRIGGFGFDFELLMLARRAGHAVREVPIHCEHKIGGTVRLRTYLTVLGEIASIRWNLLRGLYPKSRR
ncbi:MAG: glycosyltransferase [Planctomycetes bacterium]|nr:glycosyltransferase [Planctomycetota bacterium]